MKNWKQLINVKKKIWWKVSDTNDNYDGNGYKSRECCSKLITKLTMKVDKQTNKTNEQLETTNNRQTANLWKHINLMKLVADTDEKLLGWVTQKNLWKRIELKTVTDEN